MPGANTRGFLDSMFPIDSRVNQQCGFPELFRAANLADKNYHIGLRWDESSRAWLWTDGTPAHHTAWDWGEPVREDDHYRVYDGTGDHDCVYAVLRGEGIKWRTVPCDRERDDVQRGVCEVDRSRVD